jgi:hypothetical protein
LSSRVYAQNDYNTDSLSICQKRKQLATIGLSGAYAASMTGLYYLWYADFPQSRFHFFNDNKEWLQMDKAGHVFTAYMAGSIGYQAAKYSCFDENTSVFLGGSLGLIFLTTIELFDGFSEQWGASWGDAIANTLGYGLFVGQQYFFKEQIVKLKFSFSPSPYAVYRPNLLGSNVYTQVIKDYNAQTYWLSFHPESIFRRNSENILPDWVNVSLGYSADGMLGGFSNPIKGIDGVKYPFFERQRQFYFSLDIDFNKIHTNSKFLKKVFYLANFAKIPFPALYFSEKNGMKMIPLYF